MSQTTDQFGNPIEDPNDPTSSLYAAGLGAPAGQGAGALNTGTAGTTATPAPTGGALPNQSSGFSVTPAPGGASNFYVPGQQLAPNAPNLGAGGIAAAGVTQTGAPAKYGDIQGFDSGKLGDASYSSAKYDPAVRAFSAYIGTGGAVGRNNLQGAVDYAKKNGFANAQVVGDDKIDFGDGNGPIDVVQSNGSIWFQNGADRLGGGGGGATGAGGSGTGTGGAGAVGGGTGGPDFSGLEALLQQQMAQSSARDAASADYNKKIHDSILSQIDSNSAPIDPNTDKPILAATQAYQGAGERNVELEREALAESAHANGASSGSTEAGTKQAFEKLGQNQASYKANLVLDRLKQQQAALQDAIHTGAGVMTAEEAQQANERLQNINQQIQEQGLKANTNLAQQDLGLRSQLGNKGLDQQNGQFYDTYASNLANENNSLDALLTSYLMHQGAA